MTSYSCCFYRWYSKFPEGLIAETLRALEKSGLGFYPLQLVTGPNKSTSIRRGSEFDPSVVPSEYFISPGVVRLPLEGANGVSLAFTDSDDPAIASPNLVFEFSSSRFEEGGWRLVDVLNLFRQVVPAFQPDIGYLYDDRQRSRPVYRDRLLDPRFVHRPLGVFWVNFFGFKAVTPTLGFREVEPMLAHFEEVDQLGYLFALQEELYDEGNPTHRDLQETVEAKLLAPLSGRNSLPSRA